MADRALVVPPIPVELTFTTTVSRSPYQAFAAYPTVERYYRGDRVFNDPDDGGDGRDYECRYSSYRPNDGRPDQYSHPWIDLGISRGEVDDYNTDAIISYYLAWASGATVYKGQRVYDAQTNHDFEALVAITSADNTISPSSAVLHEDEDIAAYWHDLGPANAFACLDGEIDTRTLFNESLTMTVQAKGYSDGIVLAGLQNVSAVEVTVAAGEIVEGADFVSAASPSLWLSQNVTKVHADPGMTCSVVNTEGDAWAAYVCDGLTVGATYTYTLSADATAWHAAIWDPLINWVDNSLEKSGSGTHTASFVATHTRHYLAVYIAAGVSTFSIYAASLKQSGFLAPSLSASLLRSAPGSYTSVAGKLRTIKRLPHIGLSWPEYTITLTAHVSTQASGVGLVLPGEALALGATLVGVTPGRADYSRRDRDEYGTTRYERRGSSKEFRATVQIDDDYGDWIDAVLESLRGNPAFFDFNNGGTDYARLQIHGWAIDWTTAPTGFADYDLLTIEMEGMVE